MSTSDTVSSSRYMRKGTRACQECRRRKIKCTYANGITATCHECSENGRLCEQQGSSNSTNSAGRIAKSNPRRLKVRVTRLETVVERLAKVLPEKDFFEPLHGENHNANLGIQNTSNGLERNGETSLPIYALFQNEVLSTTDNLSLPPAVEHTVIFHQPYKSVPELLLSTVAKEKDLLTVLDLSSAWWPPFRNHYSEFEIPSLHLHGSLLDFVVHNLASEDPILISIGLVAIATSLQTLRPGIGDQTLYLSASCTEIMNRILAAVDQFVLNTGNQHEERTVEFSEVVLLLLRGKVYAESNQLRKAWLGIRRALLLSQKIANRGERLRGFLDGLLETDRFFSMFLGLPYATDADFDKRVRIGEGSAEHSDDLTKKMRKMRRMAAVAAGEINDRNARPEEMALKKTNAIQHRLDIVLGALPLEFWDIDTIIQTLGSPSAAFEHLNAQFWLFQTQIFLHLPYIFHPDSSLDATASRMICLRSCRGLIRIWIFLRQSREMEAYLCRLDDFQALIASIVLIVGVLLQGLNGGEESYQQDIGAVEDVKMVFKRVEREHNGGIARQGLKVLETLGGFIEPANLMNGEAGDMREVTLFVPYLGAITVQAVQRLPSSQQLVNTSSETLESNDDFSYLKASPGDRSDAFDSGGLPNDGELELGFEGGNDKFDDLALDLFDWEKFMMGTELNQDWNGQLWQP